MKTLDEIRKEIPNFLEIAASLYLIDRPWDAEVDEELEEFVLVLETIIRDVRVEIREKAKLATQDETINCAEACMRLVELGKIPLSEVFATKKFIIENCKPLIDIPWMLCATRWLRDDVFALTDTELVNILDSYCNDSDKVTVIRGVKPERLILKSYKSIESLENSLSLLFGSAVLFRY